MAVLALTHGVAMAAQVTIVANADHQVIEPKFSF